MRLLSIFSFLLVSVGFIQAQSSAISISLSDSAFFVAKINGTSYNEPSQVIRIMDIRNAEIPVEINQIKVVGNSKIFQPIVNTIVTLQAGKHMHVVIDKAHRMNVVLTEEYSGNQKSANNYAGPFIPDPNRIPVNTQIRTTREGMSDQKFKEQEELLRNINSERQRFILAKDLLSLGTLKSSQVAEMMMLFSSESNRINLADEGQKHVVDPQNYQVVFEALNRPRSLRRLSRKLSN